MTAHHPVGVFVSAHQARRRTGKCCDGTSTSFVDRQRSTDKDLAEYRPVNHGHLERLPRVVWHDRLSIQGQQTQVGGCNYRNGTIEVGFCQAVLNCCSDTSQRKGAYAFQSDRCKRPMSLHRPHTCALRQSMQCLSITMVTVAAMTSSRAGRPRQPDFYKPHGFLEAIST